ncbi:hypothetical protein MH928_07550 [Flavobacterium sp. WW92]|uniref:DUF7079 family protein n=1 Tax=unclassified Flavobacterium TaxID=196869 RepID=UPI00222510AB|nr:MULTISPECIES: hypothetical protein [unclassified Flavobacterium]WDO14542.1 hypothetical protein MH928_07550 [Flavobacterium sp. WW92]
MKKTSYKLSERKPIWISLSQFYLDTELKDNDFTDIAFKIIESPYTFEEVKKINQHEIFPVLQNNLLSIADEWAGFDEEWLIEEITKRINKKSFVSTLKIKINYRLFKSMQKEYWSKLKKEYDLIKKGLSNKSSL